MKNIVRRTFVILVVLLLTTTALFAGGSKEKDETTKSEGDIDKGSVYNFCNSLADKFDAITENLCLSISPFPSVLKTFYPKNPRNNMQREVNKDFYTNNNSFWKYSLYNLDKNNIYQKTSSSEKSAWSYTSRMFALFLSAEIIVLAIKKFLTGENDILKEIITKIIVCIFLVLFLSLTPFLIELFRIGLQNTAIVITGAENQKISSCFSLPGDLIRSQADLVANLSFENMATSYDDTDLGSSVSAGYLTAKLFGGLYLLCRIFAMFLVLIMALHVMVNVIEVYLVLAVCMCLVPFSVFSITKHLGEKALPCLFNNIMELFIIFLIFYTMTTMLSVLASYDILSTEESAPPVQLVVIPYTVDKDSEDYNGKTAKMWNIFSEKMAGKNNPTFDEVMKGLNETYFKDFLDSKKGKIYAKKISPDQTENVSVTKISELKNGDVKLYRDYLIKEVQKKSNGRVNVEKFLKFTDAIGPGFSSYCFMHIMTYLVTLFIVFTFIKRSSQITNSILSGNVSTGGNSALAIAIAMRAAKDVTKAGMGLAGLAGKGGRAGVGWSGDKLRTAKPNSKIASMMQWSTKSSMYNEMKQQEIKRRSQETIAALGKK